MSQESEMKENTPGLLTRLRKGQMSGVDMLIPLAISVVALVIIVSVGSLVLVEFDNVSTDADFNTTVSDGQEALGIFGNFFTVIVIIGIAAVLFLLLRVVRAAGGGGGTV